MDTAPLHIAETVKKALEEDIGSGDISSFSIAENTRASARLISRETALLCGREWFDEAFRQVDPSTRIEWLTDEATEIVEDQVLCRIEGPARALLSAERSAMNLLQTLSGTATTTRRFVSLIEGTGCRLLDTRKTIPGLRLAQKYAVRCGGGVNHRIGLFDAFLLKENHLIAAGGIAAAVRAARDIDPDRLLEVEVESLDELEQARDAGVDRILLDNFPLPQLREAVALIDHAIELEASGDITESNIRAVAETGVDYISIGALTKHLRAIDFSIRFELPTRQ
jgi:nicotinate-nucleotide pyrophosphorylase (carboxylating)